MSPTLNPTTDIEAPANVPADRVVDFDMYGPPFIEEGTQEAWKRLQSHSDRSLLWTPRNGGHWIAIRGDLIQHMFSDFKHFSSECPFLPREAGIEYSFIPTSMDPPEQRPYRQILNASVGPHVIDRIGEDIRSTAREIIEQIKSKGSCDFAKEYAEVFPIQVFLNIVDLPLDDAPRLKYIGDQMTRPDGTMTMGQAIDMFFDYLSPYIDERTQNPGPDAISTVVTSTVNGRPITKDEAQKICGLILLAGLDTVVNFLSFTMNFLGQNPDHRRQIAADPSIIPTATEELLRRFGVVSDARLVKKDIEIDGVTLKADDMVALPTVLYGIDDRKNKCPMDVDFARQDVTHITFGHGVHHCAGAHLARTEIQITLEEWFKAIPDFEVSDTSALGFQSGIVASMSSVPLQWNDANA